jgi:hypothetical protein
VCRTLSPWDPYPALYRLPSPTLCASGVPVEAFTESKIQEPVFIIRY